MLEFTEGAVGSGGGAEFAIAGKYPVRVQLLGDQDRMRAQAMDWLVGERARLLAEIETLRGGRRQ